ncbi:MAG: alginate lyase family protein [Clostridia bacterium]|nr:alginate lyase family protein [Clostridia bacterium]
MKTLLYFNETELLQRAKNALLIKPVHITDQICPLSQGTPHDFYSNGDYWWPNPETKDGLPYIRRDGRCNSEAFFAHRNLLQTMKNAVADLAAGYRLTGKEAYAQAACRILREFFLDAETKMNPNLCFAQAIPGVCPGRGIGIIDTLHLVDVPYSIEALKPSPAMTDELCGGLLQWFREYLHWMQTHEYGIAEMNESNNHSVCWFAQAAVYARLIGDQACLSFCRKQFREVLIPQQMASDGSFPAELARTKPYNYSLFVADNMCTICQAASCEEDDLWAFALPDGRGMERAIDFIYPYLADKSSWPYLKDVEHFDSLPVKASFLLFAGLAYHHEGLLRKWMELPSIADCKDPEMIRNVAVKQPFLWLSMN